MPPSRVNVTDGDGVKFVQPTADGGAGAPDGGEAARFGFKEQRIDWRGEGFGTVVGAQDAYLQGVEPGLREAQVGVLGCWGSTWTC